MFFSPFRLIRKNILQFIYMSWIDFVAGHRTGSIQRRSRAEK